MNFDCKTHTHTRPSRKQGITCFHLLKIVSLSLFLSPFPLSCISIRWIFFLSRLPLLKSSCVNAIWLLHCKCYNFSTRWWFWTFFSQLNSFSKNGLCNTVPNNAQKFRTNALSIGQPHRSPLLIDSQDISMHLVTWCCICVSLVVDLIVVNSTIIVVALIPFSAWPNR